MIKKTILIMAAIGSISAQGAFAQSADTDGDLVLTHLELIQTADTMNYSDGVLTLVDPAKRTIFVASEPRQTMGHMLNATFSDFWGAAGDGFAMDPPNAALSYSGDDGVPVQVQLKTFSLDSNGSLTYDVNVLEGEMPDTASDVVLFIDPMALFGRRSSYDKDGEKVAPNPERNILPMGPGRPVALQPRCHFSMFHYYDVCNGD